MDESNNPQAFAQMRKLPNLYESDDLRPRPPLLHITVTKRPKHFIHFELAISPNGPDCDNGLHMFQGYRVRRVFVSGCTVTADKKAKTASERRPLRYVRRHTINKERKEVRRYTE